MPRFVSSPVTFTPLERHGEGVGGGTKINKEEEGGREGGIFGIRREEARRGEEERRASH